MSQGYSNLTKHERVQSLKNGKVKVGDIVTNLTILCFDGLDAGVAERLGLSMPHQVELEIPKELYHNGVPHTLHVWPSMFVGEITVYHGFELTRVQPINPIRLRIRNELNKHGFKWKRHGLKIQTYKKLRVHELENKLSRPSPLDIPTVFNNHSSFIYHIPRVDPLYIWGVNLDYAQHEYLRVLALSLMLNRINVLKAFFSRIIDLVGHFSQDADNYYREIFTHAQTLKGDVILVSDHGCVKGLHTETAYMGANFTFKAKTILDVRDVIESRARA